MAESSITGQPVSPSAVYRPMRLAVQRAFYSPAQVAFIRPADASDVSTLGNGLAVGDILVKHGTLAPDVTAGEWVLLAKCGAYDGEHQVINDFDAGGNHYLVIDSADYGSVTPSSPVGTVVKWLHDYAIHVKVLVYPNPAGTPREIILEGTPDGSGLTEFYLDKYLKTEFDLKNLGVYALPVGGGSVVQNANNLTAVFYRLHVAEVFDVPGEDGEVDPFDGEHDVLVDDVGAVASFRVAVNAVHPYQDWGTDGFGAYVVGAAGRKFLTQAPRETLVSTTVGPRLTMADSDRFRVHMLASSTAVGSTAAYACDYVLRVRQVNADGSTGAQLLEKTISIAGNTPAFSVAVGPADLEPFMTLPTRYRAYVSNASEAILSEPIDITVETACRENRTAMACLNLLGGVDHYTFTGRLWREAKDGRVNYKVSSAPLGAAVRAWVVQLFGERGPTATVRTSYAAGTGNSDTEHAYQGALAVERLSDTLFTPVIFTNDLGVAASSGPYGKPVTLEYRRGVDNTSQRR